jgi:hypothetical protein
MPLLKEERMSHRTHVGLLAMSAALGLVTSDPAAQEASLVPSFPTAVIRPVYAEDLKASYRRDGNTLTMTVRTNDGRAPQQGWAGVCVENRTPVNLGAFNVARATIESSERVVMDIKLEKTLPSLGTILLVDKGVVGRGERRHQWNLKAATEVGGGGTLSQTRRMCFFVLSDDFPGVSAVVVKVSNITFDVR